MTDKKSLAIIQILHSSITGAFFVNLNLMFVIAAKSISVTLRYGNSPASCFPFLIFGWLEKTRFNTFDRCYDWASLGLRLCDKYCKDTIRAERGQVYELFGALISWNKNPPSEDLNYLTKSFQYCIQVGDHAYACYNCFHIISITFSLQPLHDLFSYGRQYIDFARTSKKLKLLTFFDVLSVEMEDIKQIVESVLRCAKTLQGGTNSISDQQYYIDFIEKRTELTKSVHSIFTMRTLYLLEDYDEAYLQVICGNNIGDL
jgi:hypothetical protein